MTSTDDADLVALAAATNHLVAVLDSIEDGQWALPTPCSEWDVTALVDHVTGGNWFTLEVLDGRSADEAMQSAIARFGDGSATREDAIRSATDQLAAFRADGILDGTWHHVAGQLPGSQILRLRFHDLVVHAWDLGQAIAPPASVPADLVAWGLEELGRPDSLTAQHITVAGAPEAEGSEPGSEPRTAGTSYLAAFGR